MRDLIQVARPGAAVAQRSDEILAAIERVLASGRYVLGREVEDFEREFSRFVAPPKGALAVGASHRPATPQCVAVGSGTDALTISLLSLGIGPGDEVLTVANTAVATVAAIEATGATVALVDVDPITRCLDAGRIASAVSARTRAVVPVHLYGQPADMPTIVALAEKLSLLVVEDCAQAVGATIDSRHVGTFGHAAAFSFYPTKNLGALGDAGAVVSMDSSVVALARSIAQYGWDEQRISQRPGRCSRMDPLQAAILRVQLGHLPRDLGVRRSIAVRYSEAIRSNAARAQCIVAPAKVEGTRHAFHLYVVEAERRALLAKDLRDAGIETACHYPIPIHRQPAYWKRLPGSMSLGVSERLAEEVLTLPLYPQMEEDEIERVVSALEKVSVGEIGTAEP